MAHTPLANLSRIPGFDRLRSAAIALGQPVLLTSLAVSGLVLGLRAVGVFERPGLALYDQFVRLQPPQPLEGPDERLLVVGIDEADLQSLGEWPLSDDTLARILEALQVHQPRVIGVDILRDIPIGAGRDRLLGQLQQPNVVIVCKVNSASDPGAPPPAGLPPESVVFADLTVDSGGTLRRSLMFVNPPPLETPAAVSHVCNSPGTVVSLSFGAALNYLAAEGIAPSFTEAGQLVVGETPFPVLTPDFGSYRGTDVAGYQTMLRYRAEEGSVPVVSLSDVLDGLPAEQVRNRIVLIGYTTPLAKDDFYTPYSAGRDDQQKMPGVVVHAQSTSQILSAVLDGRSLVSEWPLAVEVLWIGGWTLVTGLFAWYVKRPSWFVAGVVMLGGAAYGSALLLFLQGVWVPLVPVLTSIAATASGVIMVERFHRSDYGKRLVNQVKTFLQIDIDEERLDRQVAEITETEYFQDLKSTVETLRSQPIEALEPLETESSEPNDGLDLLADLNAEVQQIKRQSDSTADG
ncbi:MAG: CHASE2 domain-containing protein [Elainellaceae cyanobacterium]